jgi:hypothetical protein
MSELRRLVQGEGDEFEQALLQSASVDAPSDRVMRRTLVALGIGTSVVATGTAAAAAVGTAAGVAGRGMAVAAVQAAGGAGTQAAIGVLFKWVGIAAVGGFVTLGSVDQAQRYLRRPEAAVTVVAPVAERARAAAERRERPGGTGAGAARAPAPAGSDPCSSPDGASGPECAGAGALRDRGSAPGAAAGGARAAAEGAGGAAHVPSLTDEVAALDRVHGVLERGDPAGALRALESYRRDFAGGTLGPEADVLRVEILARAGRIAEARAAAAAFLTRHPSSPLAQRVRSLVGEGGGP